MDWSNEDYVRVYIRDTTDDLELSWQAMALWHAMLRKFDRSGLLEARNGWASVAKVVRIPEDVVLAAGAELERDGRVMRTKRGILAPNFTEAQTARKSDKARQRESRDRRRADAIKAGSDNEPQTRLHLPDPADTCHTMSPAGHDVSRDVTLPLLSSADPLLRVAMDPGSAVAEPSPKHEPSLSLTSSPNTKRSRKTVKHDMPENWQPSARQRETCRVLGLDVDEQSRRFKNHHAAKGNQFASWDRAFDTWLDNAPRFANRTNGVNGHHVGRVEPRNHADYGDGDMKL